MKWLWYGLKVLHMLSRLSKLGEEPQICPLEPEE